MLPAYTLLHITCNCDDTDVDTMYLFTLFDTGANPTSFVNRQVAAWIESQQSPQALGKRKHSPAPAAAVSLAELVSLAGSVNYNLTIFNEVTRSNETLYRLHANVIDSCIDIIVGTILLFESTISYRKFPISSIRRRALNSISTPVTPKLAKLSRVCAQPCTTCTSFVMQGYDNTLCPLTMMRPDRARRVCRPNTD